MRYISFVKNIISAFIILWCSQSLYAQQDSSQIDSSARKSLEKVSGEVIMSNNEAAEKKEHSRDSLVRLVSGKSFELIQKNGKDYRKVTGPATFFHNGTYLLCDTALWNVAGQIIQAAGHVKIMQENTELTSDKLDYLIDKNLAEFRGSIVQLEDKDRNILRTRHLDFNTKDSTAIFFKGGAMKDSRGQTIESNHGTYDARIKTFTFTENVNMFTDSIFIATSKLVYQTDSNIVTFDRNTNAWQEKNMLSANAGWYDRNRDLFLFRNNVHLMSDEQEGWADSLYYYKMSNNIKLFGNSQVVDTVRDVASVAGYMEYNNALSQITLRRDPALIMFTSKNEKEHPQHESKKDTIYFGGDKIVYHTLRRCDIDSLFVESSNQRIEDIHVDAVAEYRKKAAEEAREKAKKAAEESEEFKAKMPPKGKNKVKSADKAKTEEIKDSLDVAQKDSLQTDGIDVLAVSEENKTDSIATKEPLDTTKIGFLTAIGNVQLYKRDMQIACDSLEYCDLDSLVRLYNDPVVWNDDTRQYSADSIQVLVRGRGIERAFLMSNAFVTFQEDSLHFDQIKSTEMMAYFDSTGAISRFDALGGASALFYIREKDELATVNTVETKMIYSIFKEGQIDRIYYFDAAKNNAFPVVQMQPSDLELSGFKWRGDERPKTSEDITPYSLRPSERSKYNSIKRAPYKETELYFPGYIEGVYREIAISDSLKAVRKHQRQMLEDARRLEEKRVADSVALAEKFRTDSLARVDSLAKIDSLALKDSLSKEKALTDSLANAAKNLSADSLVVKTKAELRKERQEARAKRAAARKASREKRWAEKDKRDAEKAARKKAEKLKKERDIKRKELKAAQERKREELDYMNEYIEKYQERKAKEDERQRLKAERKAATKKSKES